MRSGDSKDRNLQMIIGKRGEFKFKFRFLRCHGDFLSGVRCRALREGEMGLAWQVASALDNEYLGVENFG